MESSFALLVMELGDGRSTCTLYCHLLLHTWGLPRLSECTSDEAGESNLRLSKHFTHVTSTVPNDSIRECLAHESYMKLVHKGLNSASEATGFVLPLRLMSATPFFLSLLDRKTRIGVQVTIGQP